MESELMMMRKLLAMLQEKEAHAHAGKTAGGYNCGTQGSFTNNGPGGQNFGDVNYNSGAYAGNRYSNPVHRNGNGGNSVRNSGYTQGNGNGSIVNSNSPVPSNRKSCD